MNVKYEIKRAIVGFAATTMAAPITAVGIYVLYWLLTTGVFIYAWGLTAITAIIISKLSGVRVEDRSLQDILVDSLIVALLIGFVPGIYLKDLFRVARYPAEDKLVRWFERRIPCLATR